MPHCRVISGLQWTRLLEGRPKYIPVGRPRGSKLYGLKYESAFGSKIEYLFGPIANVLRGRWFEFADANGPGCCQPDVIVPFEKYIVVCECKLTETAAGRDQINLLYRPILEAHYKMPVRGVVVTRHLTRETNRSVVVDSMEEAIRLSNSVIPTLHWLGRGKI